MGLFSMIKYALTHRGELKEKRKKHRRRKIIIIVVALGLIFVMILTTVILPIFYMSSAINALDLHGFTNNTGLNPNGNQPGVNVTNGDGTSYYLQGGLKAMGVDFDKTIAELQDLYNKSDTQEQKEEYAGRIAYAQLIQLMDAMTEATDHPILLLLSAMAIRETGTFSPEPAAWYRVDVQGQSPELGVYGTWCKENINGLPQTGGGVIKHNTSYVAESHNSSDTVPAFTFIDYQTGATYSYKLGAGNTDITWSSLINSSGKVITYNRGAYGPLQVEADHFCSWVCPIRANKDTFTKDGKKDEDIQPYIGKNYVNIPIDVKIFDNYWDSQPFMVGSWHRSIVTPSNGHLSEFRKNKDFADNIMTTVGHADYIESFANLVKNTEAGKNTFGVSEYYFKDRFTDAAKTWDDYIISLEAWPNAYILAATYCIGKYCAFTNKASINNSESKTTNDYIFFNTQSSSYGFGVPDTPVDGTLNFVNRKSAEIYWALNMLMAWNYGSPCSSYSLAKNPKQHNTAYFFKELSDYIAVHGTAEIYKEVANWEDSCAVNKSVCECGAKQGKHSVSHDSGGGSTHNNAATKLYTNLLNLCCTANGTMNTDSYNKALSAINEWSSISSSAKNNYAYAITAILDADIVMKKRMKQIFNIDDFNIFDYGAPILMQQYTDTSVAELEAAGVLDTSFIAVGTARTETKSNGDMILYVPGLPTTSDPSVSAVLSATMQIVNNSAPKGEKDGSVSSHWYYNQDKRLHTYYTDCSNLCARAYLYAGYVSSIAGGTIAKGDALGELSEAYFTASWAKYFDKNKCIICWKCVDFDAMLPGDVILTHSTEWTASSGNERPYYINHAIMYMGKNEKGEPMVAHAHNGSGSLTMDITYDRWADLWYGKNGGKERVVCVGRPSLAIHGIQTMGIPGGFDTSHRLDKYPRSAWYNEKTKNVINTSWVVKSDPNATSVYTGTDPRQGIPSSNTPTPTPQITNQPTNPGDSADQQISSTPSITTTVAPLPEEN